MKTYQRFIYHGRPGAGSETADREDTPPDQEAPPLSPAEQARYSARLGAQIAALVHNPGLPPQQKAQAVYQHARQLMLTLFEQPTAELIGATKQAVGHIVDLILADDATSQNLLTVSQHDYNTYTHCVNVGIYAVSLAKRLFRGAEKHNMQELGAGFFLHDIGKTRIDPAIINKPGRLNNREMAFMRSHPSQSFAILQNTRHATPECSLIALQHHERENGTGYPCGRKGDEIHNYARICSIADVFDALVSERPYKDPLTVFQALEVMRNEMIGHFHRELFENFVLLFDGR